ncbi:glycosyl transferase family protein [Tolypothrix tenuis PCC 7101]|uniref:Glycosyl transferase family protein n=1 Tax=Tolypothrix tenuis PCC 7101 TaxID=231146 RepID=A0A1Z4MWM6_9CYAN|nr:glycosyltransferase [Aulosira sp. FACHB-113]BAY97878.1 glycosyl transferase family protein [Tolypothrix tenuis PCC 7101]BAZ71615.1 glycosyl transferase family protein [Aulosira laxa NIES-50]
MIANKKLLSKISVIIPVYNSENTIAQTINSVLQQTFTNFELIVINDGSLDSTLEIISKINDDRLKIFSFDNAGANVSRNRGLKYAVGEFVSFLDADDLWTPDKLESQFQALQANPQAAVAYSWTNCIDEKSQFLRRGTYISATGNVYANLLLLNFLENGSNPLIRRDALNIVGGFDESLNAAQDWDIYLRLAAHYAFVAVPSPQILYRISSNSMSTNVLKLEAASLTVIERAFKKAPQSIQYSKKHSLANLYKYLLFKTLEGLPERKRTLTALRFFGKAIINDMYLLKSPTLIKVLLNIISTAMLPRNLALFLFYKFPKIFNIVTILGYMKLAL